MGGLGSGNHWRYGTKSTCGEYTRVELPFMRKKGYLTPGFHGQLSWNRGGEPSGNIRFRAQENGLQLIYRVRESGGEWESIDEFVPYQWTSQRLGGQRRWLTCLSCSRRCSILYGGKYYRCRKCWGLAYQSQNEARRERLSRRARNIRRRVGGSENLDEWFPDKPKGMHWRTYNALKEEGVRLESRVDAELYQWIMRLRG